MINDNYKIVEKEGMDFSPLPKDVHQVELLDVEMQTKATYKTRNEPEDKQVMEDILSFQFTLLEGKDGEQDLRGRNVWANFVPSYLYISQKNGKNMLYRIVEGLLGRELDQKEVAEGFSGSLINSLVGRQCRLNIEPVTKGDKTYDKINDVLKANTQLQALTSEEKKKATVNTDNDQTPPQQAPVAQEQIDNIPPSPVATEDIEVEKIPF